MKKLLLLSLLFIQPVFAEYITNDIIGGCNGIYVYRAVLAPKQITCSSGYYLPANALSCELCPSGYTCNGGTYDFNDNEFQGATYTNIITTNMNNLCAANSPKKFFTKFTPNSHTCNPGYYLPAGVDECTLCPANNLCSGGTYLFNETTDQGIQSCALGTFAPSGSSVCYPHILHVGEDVIYLKSTKQTTPSLNVQIGEDVFYANMTTTSTKMNKDSNHYFHAEWENNDYYICDDTTCPQ